MANTKYGQKRTIRFRRKRESRTDYRKRLALLKSGLPRLTIRTSANTIVCQVVDFHPDGDKVMFASSSRQLGKLGWNFHPGNMSSAYLTGLLLGRKAKKSVKKAVLDLGLQKSNKGGKVYAVLKGVIDAGLDVPASDDCFPSQDRISGKHIEGYAKQLKADKASYDKQFSATIKKGGKPEELNARFEDLKKKILSM